MGNESAKQFNTPGLVPPVTPEQSVRGMLGVMTGLGPSQSGSFLGWDGAEIPW